MKNTYIIFCRQKPGNYKMVLDLIMHFCLEHNLNYCLHPGYGGKTIIIEEQVFQVSLEKRQEEPESAYWMICCSQKNKMPGFRKIPAV